jgi:transposase InsO family protein
MKLRNNLGFLQDKRYGSFMKTINSALAFNQSEVAKFHLHCVEHFIKHGWGSFHSAFPQIGRRTIYRWRKKYLDSGKRLASLIPQSTNPHSVRQMQTPAQIMGFVKALRTKYPRLSKYKIKPFLDVFCKEQALPTYSVSWIGKLINRHQFFFNTRQIVRRKGRSLKSGTRIKYCPRQKDIKLGYLQLDAVVVNYQGNTYRFLTAIELKTRQAFVKRVASLSSKQAKIFLEEIISQTSYTIHTVQTDNGSEFKGIFAKALKELNIKELHSFPRSPKTQGYVERFNWTLQDEFIDYEIDTALISLKHFDTKLRDWNHYYNHIRPHQSLKYQTPHQFLLQLQVNNQTKTQNTDCAICV